MTGHRSITRALASSRSWAALTRALEKSRVYSALCGVVGLERVRASVQSVRAGSAVGTAMDAIQEWSSRLVAGAVVVDLLGNIGQWTRGSALYRWLTAEPEPEVIVIDLRETATVRPFLFAIDESIGLLLLGRQTSFVGAGVTEVGERLRAAPIRWLSLVVVLAIGVSTLVGAVRGTMGATGFWVRIALAVLALGGTRLDHSWAHLRQSRPARLLIALLEPPEPPARHFEDDTDPRDDRREE